MYLDLLKIYGPSLLVIVVALMVLASVLLERRRRKMLAFYLNGRELASYTCELCNSSFLSAETVARPSDLCPFCLTPGPELRRAQLEKDVITRNTARMQELEYTFTPFVEGKNE